MSAERELALRGEIERLRKQRDDAQVRTSKWRSKCRDAQAEIEQLRAALDDVEAAHETYCKSWDMRKQMDRMKAALGKLLDHYTTLINSGDAGFWDPEEEPEVIEARAALENRHG